MFVAHPGPEAPEARHVYRKGSPQTPKPQRGGIRGRIVWHGAAPLGLEGISYTALGYSHVAPLALREGFQPDNDPFRSGPRWSPSPLPKGRIRHPSE